MMKNKVSKRKCLAAAIDYVQHLQRSVEALKEEISNIEATVVREGETSRDGTVVADDVVDDASSSACNLHRQEEEEERGDKAFPSGEHMGSSVDILQFEVSRLENDVYSFHIVCKNEQQALERLVGAFEALNVDIVNANISTRNEKIHSYYIVEAKDWSSLELEGVKSRFMERISQIR